MKEKKYETKNLYILHISELVYFVPDGDTIYKPEISYVRDYYTVAEDKSDGKLKDLFNLFTTYKNNTHVGVGTIKEIEESISIDELTNFQIPSMTKRDTLVVLRDYLRTLYPKKDIEISAPKKYTKNLNMDLNPSEVGQTN